MTTTNYHLYRMVLKVVHWDEELLRIDPEDVADIRARDLLRPVLKEAEALRRQARELEEYCRNAATTSGDIRVEQVPATEAPKTKSKK